MRIIFLGTPEYAVPSLEMLINEGYEVAAVVTQPDKPKGRGKKTAPPPVKEYAQSHGIPVNQPEKVKTPEFYQWLKDMNPDLLITAAYGKILSKEILDTPPLGCINVHASLLPKYRGAAPIHWAVINGETVTGVTTMYTDIGMDTGDILLQSEVKITDTMTTGELHDTLAQLGAQVLRETLKQLTNGTLVRIPQDPASATYAPMITKDTGRIDWNRKTAEIHNLVRGTNPWPGAFTMYKGQRLRIWKTGLDKQDDMTAMVKDLHKILPGTLFRKNRDRLLIKTADGYIAVFEVQFDSGRRMDIAECGHNMDEGEILG